MVLKRQSRPVTFRVYFDEYDALAKACLNTGTRSVSEFARAAVLQKVQSLSEPNGTLRGDLATLSKQLGELDVSLEDTQKRIRGVLGSSGP